MNFFWQGKRWQEQPTKGLSRRMFLGGAAAALAAPMVVKSGILMPVRQLILPAPAEIMRPYNLFVLEESHDEKHWSKVWQIATREHTTPLMPKDFTFPARKEAPFRRVVIEKRWTGGPEQSLADYAAKMPPERIARLYRRSLGNA